MADRSGTTATVRVDRPDGTATEIIWRDLGHSSIVHLDQDGAPARHYDIALDPDGQVIVRPAVGAGATEPLESTSSSTMTNPYGATVEEHDYDGIVHVEYGFDDDGRFRTASAQEVWGRHDLEVQPDLGRTLTWSCPLHRGKGSWNAWGTLDRYEVSFADGSGFQWELCDDRGRETTIDWDGRTVVVDDAAPPTIAEGLM